jgi:ABC-2 type transport system ATP-binding protein
MDKVIEVKDLTRNYEASIGIIRKQKKTVEALKGVSFDVHKGEIFGLLGPNGAGKTTTIKILTTLLAPSAGQAKVLGHHTFGEEKALRGKINFIFGGERSLYWRLSAYDNMRYFASLYKVPQAIQKKRIPALLDKVGLLDKKDLKVETFSKGMKQRLQIARGLINDPEILFLDEPTIGLDPSGAIILRKIVKELASEGKTILLTTHYMQEADELCDRIGIIADGQLLDLDTPENLKWRLSKATLEDVYLELVGEDHVG